MQTPRYIFADDFSAFETYFKSVPGIRRSFKKGDSLRAAGQPFSPVYYILSGFCCLARCITLSSYTKSEGLSVV